LFQNVALEDSFGAGSTYNQAWVGTYAAPTLTTNGLQFGPHPLSPNWWDTYSPTDTHESDFGNILFCIRFVFQIDPSAVEIPDGGGSFANGFQMSLRGGSEGMVLGIGGVSQSIGLSTKIDASNTWVDHGSVAFALVPAAHTIEMALYGNGNDFSAEAKDVGSGLVQALHTTYALPATGTVEMLGWQLPHPLVVTRVAVGTPSTDAAARISAP
jgi:hypothetical protein